MGCRDNEIVTPSQSTSSQRTTDVEASTAHLDDDLSTQEGQERDEVDDNTTLEAWQRFAIKLKPRKLFKSFTPSDYEKRRKVVFDAAHEDEEEEEEEPDQQEEEADDEEEEEEEEEDVQPVGRRKRAVLKAARRSTRGRRNK